jgi:hypothetical protein
MKALGMLALAALLLVGFVSVGHAADETTLTGKIVCAKCSLKKAEKCQDVLLVTDASNNTTEYYIVKNDAAKEAGHQCKSESKGTVTGVVSEKDGQKWITASKIEKEKAE